MGQMFFPDEDQYGNKTHTFKWGHALIVFISILLLGGGGYWLSEKYDLFSNSSDTMYVIAEGLNLRSGKGTNSEIITFADYGERVKVIKRGETIWAKVKYEDNEGYMSLKGLAPKDEFNRLDALWGDDKIRGEVYDLRDRASLLDYSIKKKLSSEFKLYTVERAYRNYWSRSLNKKHVFAFILDNRNTGERCAAIYSYTDGEPVCELSDISMQKEQGIDEVILNDGGYEIKFWQ